jgi:addiction module HigA family antidote
MSETIEKVGMRPPHPGAFIREEILDELSLPVAKAAEILGVRRATLSDLVNEKAALSPERGHRIGFPKSYAKRIAPRNQRVAQTNDCATGWLPTGKIDDFLLRNSVA